VYGTVGAVAADRDGHLAAATSTGGTVNKRPGRVGDSPVIGAGTFAWDRTCAVSGTGHGEPFIRLGVAGRVSALMELAGLVLVAAAERTIADLGDKVSSEDKAEVDRQVTSLREALKGADMGAVRSGMESLTATLSRVATAAYQAASPMDGPGQPGPDGSNGTGESGEGEPAGARSGGGDASADDTVEGEFKEV
jgi:hypothetical protein